VQLTKYRLVGIAAITLIGVVIVLAAVGAAMKSRENTYTTRSDFEALIRSQMKEFYNGWIIVVVERGDELTRGFQRVLTDENISATVSRVDALDMVDFSSMRPQIVVFNLLDREVLNEVYSSISTIRRLMLEGSYVLFVANDSDVIREIANLFDPPLDYPSSSEVTITKAYSNGRKELVVADTLFAVGRTYKNVSGRLVPFGVGASILIDNSTTTDEAMQQLASGILKSIVAGENDLYRRWG